jgi:hypothetical protein
MAKEIVKKARFEIDPKAIEMLRREPDNTNVFSIRVSNFQKAGIYEEALFLKERLNETRGASDPKLQLNDLVVKALFLGFEQLKKKLK